MFLQLCFLFFFFSTQGMATNEREAEKYGKRMVRSLRAADRQLDAFCGCAECLWNNPVANFYKQKEFLAVKSCVKCMIPTAYPVQQNVWSQRIIKGCRLVGFFVGVTCFITVTTYSSLLDSNNGTNITLWV